ncbi:MAG: hypothetical protein P0Y66_04125 [Candidatus Kaistia colombiensis]|nr:MAG: hypothetical protein P0Y66_04125 [Kaistia sp.]
MSQAAQQKTIRIAMLAALGATVLAVAAQTFPRSVPSTSFADLMPILLSALAFLAGALAAASTRGLARRPVFGAVALIGLVPLLPDPERLALVGAFAVSGLLMAGWIGPIAAAFARERLAAISGSLGLGLIAYIAIRAGLAVGPAMQAVLALCAITAALAMTSAMLAPQRPNR